MIQTQVWITNNTNYNLTIEGTGPSNCTIAELSSVRILSNDDTNSKTLSFWKDKNVEYMKATLIFGPSSGIYADRGDLPIDDQSIKMMVNTKERQWIQSTNGGNTLLTPSEFSEGGDISVVFYT